LSRSLSAVDDARAEFSQQRSRLSAAGSDDSSEVALPDTAADVALGGANGFMQWMKIGFAVTFPLIIFGFLALFLFLWMASRGQ
jgi:hypothetical protein